VGFLGIFLGASAVQLTCVWFQYEPDQQTHTVHLVCSPSSTDVPPLSYPNAPPASVQVDL